jgi:general secretion pathway protein H
MRRTHQHSPAVCQAAFTLLELLVVLMVISLAVTLVGTQLAAGKPSLAVRGATAEMVAGLQMARNRALTENRLVVANIEVQPPGLMIDGEQRALRQVALRLLGDPSPSQRVHFYPDGSSDGLAVEITSGSASRQVSVDWLTGRVRVSPGEAGDG